MAEAEVKVRRAKARDMAFIVELWKGFSEEMARIDERYALRDGAEIIWGKWAGERLRDENSIALVAQTGAESGDDYVGYLIGHTEDAHPIFKDRRFGMLTDIFVKPDFRRKGVGKKFVEEGLAFFKGRGVGQVRMNVLVTNDASRAFCEKLGFGDFLYRMWKSL